MILDCSGSNFVDCSEAIGSNIAIWQTKSAVLVSY